MSSQKKMQIGLKKRAAAKGILATHSQEVTPEKIQSAVNFVRERAGFTSEQFEEVQTASDKLIQDMIPYIKTPGDKKLIDVYKEIQRRGKATLTTMAEATKDLKLMTKNISKTLKIGITEELSYTGIEILGGLVLSYIGALTSETKGMQEKHFLMSLSYLSLNDRKNLFSLIYKLDFQDEFEQAIKEKIVPIKWRGYYTKWKKFNDVSAIEKFYTSEENNDEVEEDLDISTEEIPNEITIIETSHALVLPGEDDEMIATLHEENEELEPKNSHDRYLKRNKIIALLEEAGIPKSAMTLYREKAVQGSQTNSYPYQVLDIQDEHLRAQIVLCNWTKFSTFIIRDPAPMDPKNPIIISDLKDNDAVWRVVHNNEQQWMNAVYKHLFTPVSSLPVQFKHIVAWEDQKAQLLHSFAAQIAATGRIPRSNDTTLIEYGALKGRATWSRAYGALTRGSINGLGNIRNFHDLYEHLAAKDSRIEKFKGRQPLPHAQEIFNQCVRFARETGVAPQQLFYGDMVCFDRHAKQTSDGFKFHAIKGWRGLVDDPTQRPVSLEEFVIATGIATRNGGELELVENLDLVIAQVKQRTDNFHKEM